MATPALAGDIEYTAWASGEGEVTITYQATDPQAVPVGLGVKVSLEGACGAYLDGVVSSSAQFNVHIDYASEDPCNYTIPAEGTAGQNPTADPCEAGVADPCSSEFSICMGRLDPCELADPCVDLVTLSIGCTAGVACTVTVNIEADNLRGGTVGAEFGAVTYVDGTVECETGEPPCPFSCWETATQCHGDSAGAVAKDGNPDGMTYVLDWPDFRDGFSSKNWGDSPGHNGKAEMSAGERANYLTHVCADYDHDGEIYVVDWPQFRDNFSSSVPTPADCAGDCAWPPPLP
jgi:hypothetical protein